MKMLLIVEDDEIQATALVALLEERNVSIKVADSGKKPSNCFPAKRLIASYLIWDWLTWALLNCWKR